MPLPIEVCLEDLDLPAEDERYLRCVALPDAQPGLALDAAGQVQWMPDAEDATGLWVSADDRLILICAAGGPGVEVRRDGRSLRAPAGQPVVLLDGDRLRVAGRRLRLHVHGPTAQIAPPEPVPASALSRLARTAVSALALGAATLGGAVAAGQGTDPPGPTPIQVRARPPKMAAPRHPVDCPVLSSAAAGPGLQVEARCPAGARIFQGMRGSLLGADGKPLPGGTVVVQSVARDRVVARGAARPRTRATHVRFLVSRP